MNSEHTPSAFQFDNEMAEILESFLIETNEIIERLGQDLLTLERTPSDAELHNTIFRAVHTIKGTSSFLGLHQMTTLAHRCEDVLNKVRKGELVVTSRSMDVMFEAYDLLKVLLQRIEQKNAEPVDLTGILEKLESVGQNDTPADLPLPPVVPVGDLRTPAQESEEKKEIATQESEDDLKPAERETASPAGGSQAKVSDTTIRVEVSRLDGLMNLVGELVLGRNRLAQIATGLLSQHEDIPAARELNDTSSQIDLITTELQMAVMKTRMVPIAKVFNKLPRLMRDLCKETGKDIELQMIGEETEMDKSIIEELNDPLVHILRNAADHGIEPPSEREHAGKPPRGNVAIKAEHEGNRIVIVIHDDGKGMDPEVLKLKAVEKGIITQQQAREMSRREAFDLIFLPGFSTAKQVTNVSGRGVGMDVVRTNIAKLKGIVEIDSEVGRGSTFTIKLPLTLAIIQGLLVEVSREFFCVPLASVLEVVRVRADDIETIRGQEVIRLRDSVLPLARLQSVFRASNNGSHVEWIYVVVVGVAEQRLGIVVDSLLGQKEVVIKSLGGYLGSVPGVAGSTILGDGRVIMILDVMQLMTLVRGEAVS
jgi:two-component system chemotaxis sensor kinase CheA